MKDYLADLVAEARSHLRVRNLAREYLQARILASLQRSAAMIPLAFHGGTALRFLHRLPRHSEDLGFALEGSHDLYRLQRWLDSLRTMLCGEDCSVELRTSLDRVV